MGFEVLVEMDSIVEQDCSKLNPMEEALLGRAEAMLGSMLEGPVQM